MARGDTLNKRASATPTITSGSAYSANNVVGGVLTFLDIASSENQGGILVGMVRDKSGNAVLYDLILFDSLPGGTYTDKTGIALGTDLAKVIGALQFGTLVGGGTPGFLMSSANLPFKLTAAPGSRTLYGVLVTRGTPTYTGTSDVTVDLVNVPDGG